MLKNFSPKTAGLAVLFTAALVLGHAHSAAAADKGNLVVSLADPAWDGKTVPSNQVCKRFGGTAFTPAIKIGGLPDGAHSIVLAFGDETFAAMADGGHGIIRFTVPKGAKEITLTKVPGETDTLPAGVSVVTDHRGSGWSGTGGAYLPPCSGGRGNSYYTDIKVQDADGNDINATFIDIGTY